jgi:hypothetical protein
MEATLCQAPCLSCTKVLHRFVKDPKKHHKNSLCVLWICQDQSEDTYLVYETDHIQKLFLRTIETDLQEQELDIYLP